MAEVGLEACSVASLPLDSSTLINWTRLFTWYRWRYTDDWAYRKRLRFFGLIIIMLISRNLVVPQSHALLYIRLCLKW